MLAHKWFERAHGWLGKKQVEHGEGLLITPCSAVHTFGMYIPIDVLFLDRTYKIVKIVPSLMPWRVAYAAAHSALELPAGTSEKTGVAVGDELDVTEKPPFA